MNKNGALTQVYLSRKGHEPLNIIPRRPGVLFVNVVEHQT
jgi:hypothetical protein